jgi:signal transduction histidine kinase/CheY-like chemotaxis protein
MSLTARDALSESVCRVGAYTRPVDLGLPPRGELACAVFDENEASPDRERFLGVAGCKDMLLFPYRIFADLVPSPRPDPIAPTASLDEVVSRLERGRASSLPVVEEKSGRFVGVITQTSLLRRLLDHERRLRTEAEKTALNLNRTLRRARTRSERVAALNAGLTRLLGVLASTSLEEELLRVGIEELTAVLQTRYGAVGLVDRSGRHEVFVHSGVSREEAERIGRPPEGKGLLGIVVREGEILRIDDIGRDPRAAGLPPHHPAMKTLLAVPVLCQGEVVGRVYLADRKDERPFSEEDEVLAAAFAKFLSLIVAHHREVVRRQQAEEMLRQRQKLEAIGHLAGGVAHDFNNILTVIFGHCEMLASRFRGDRAVQREIEEMSKVAERGASLARQLLAFGRRQILLPRVISLNTVVTGMKEMLRKMIGEDVVLEAGLPSDLGHVKVDPGQMEQVVMNLVVNARDAMPRGGRLTIATADVDLDATFCSRHAPTAPGRYVRLQVKDEGCGMDKETLARVFEPFFTTKEKGKGTGLGLATVYGIVKQSGGYIWIESKAGRGSTFSVYLPRVDELIDAPAPKAGTRRVARGSETVMVVEDEPMVRDLLRETLEMSGYAVLVAEGGAGALEACERHSGPLHLLITDVVLPMMSGHEVAERVRRLRPEIKVLYMSGYSDPAVASRGLLQAGADFLQKPFTPTELELKIREVLGATAKGDR